MANYLWLVTLDQHTVQGTYHSAVVVAESAPEAKCMLPTGRAIGSQVTWCSPDFVSVRCLGIAEPGLESVICVSTTSKGE